MQARLEQLAPSTVFTYNGMLLRRGCTMGPWDPKTQTPTRGGGEQAYACDRKAGGQWQTDTELQVWVPLKAVVTLD